MSFASRHNTAHFDFSAFSNNTFISLKELLGIDGEGMIYTLEGLYINTKSKYGNAPVAVINGYNVNLPSHKLEEVKEILSNDEDIQDIRNHKVGFTIRPYTKNDTGNEYFSIEWVDL